MFYAGLSVLWQVAQCVVCIARLYVFVLCLDVGCEGERLLSVTL